MWTDNPYPHQIVMKPNLFVHLIESNNNWRVVRIPRPHKPTEEQEPLYMGDTASRWEGDTLVLETISLDTDTWIQGNGWYQDEQTQVIERLRRPSMNYLEYQYTVEDPKVLTKPWTSAWRTLLAFGQQRRSDRELLHQQRERRAVHEARRAGARQAGEVIRRSRHKAQVTKHKSQYL